MKKIFLPIALALTTAATLSGTTYTWNGGIGIWLDAANWLPNGVPSTEDTVIQNSGSCKIDGDIVVAHYAQHGHWPQVNTILDGIGNFRVTGDLIMSGFRLFNIGHLDVGGDLLWTWGEIGDPAQNGFHATVMGQVKLLGTHYKDLCIDQLLCNGGVAANGDLSLDSGTELVVPNGQTFTVPGACNILAGNYGGGGSIQLSGTFLGLENFQFKLANTIHFYNYGTVKGSGNMVYVPGAFHNLGTVSPGVTIGQLTLTEGFENLFLDIAIAPNGLGGAKYDRLVVSGPNLTLTGSGLNVSAIPGVPDGAYPILHWNLANNGQPTGSFFYTNLPPGYTLVFDPVGKNYLLQSTGNCFTMTVQKTPITCAGGSNGTATAFPSGASGNTYAWSNGGTTQTITGLSAGTYTVTVTKTPNCSLTRTVTLPDPPGMDLVLETIDVKCKGGNDGRAKATATGGTGSKTYAWSNGTLGQTILNLPAGAYTVTVTDAKGCTKTAAATVAEPPAVALAHTVETLSNGKYRVTLTASGGIGSPYKYCKLSTSNTCSFGLNNVFSNLLAGDYTFRTRDRNLCEKSITVTVPTGGTRPESRVWASPSEPSLAANPNPASEVLHLQIAAPATGDCQLLLHDLTGRLLRREILPQAGVFEKNWDVSGLPAGVYALTLSGAGAEVSRRVVIQH